MPTQAIVPSPLGFFTPDPLTPAQVEYMRAHRINYSAPGEIEGIRQYETFGGIVNIVHVHPSFPSEPVLTNDGRGWRGRLGPQTYATSNRRAAIILARVQRSRPDTASYLYQAENVAKMVAAAQAVISLMDTHMVAGELDRTGDAWATQASEVLNAINWDHENPALSGALIWGSVSSTMVTLTYTPTSGRDANNWAHNLVSQISWCLLRMADQGLMTNRAATALCDQLRSAAGLV